MSLDKTGPAEIAPSTGEGPEAVSMRLRTLLQLALAIGRREGLLGNRPGIEEGVVTKEGSGSQIREAAATGPQIGLAAQCARVRGNGKDKTM